MIGTSINNAFCLLLEILSVQIMNLGYYVLNALIAPVDLTPEIFVKIFPLSNSYIPLIKYGAYCIMGVIVLFQLHKSMLSNHDVLTQRDSPLVLVGRFAVAFIMISLSMNIMNAILNTCSIAFNNATIYVADGSAVGAFTSNSGAELIDNFITGLDESWNKALVSSTNGGKESADAGMLMLRLVFSAYLMYKLFQFSLQILERYVSAMFMAMLSPLAMATYPSRSTLGIFKAYLSQFISNILLLFLNMMFLRIILVSYSEVGIGITEISGEVASESGEVVSQTIATLTPAFCCFIILAMVKVASTLDSVVARVMTTAVIGNGLAAEVGGAYRAAAHTAGAATGAVKAGVGAGVATGKGIAKVGKKAYSTAGDIKGKIDKINAKNYSKAGERAKKNGKDANEEKNIRNNHMLNGDYCNKKPVGFPAGSYSPPDSKKYKDFENALQKAHEKYDSKNNKLDDKNTRKELKNLGKNVSLADITRAVSAYDDPKFQNAVLKQAAQSHLRGAGFGVRGSQAENLKPHNFRVENGNLAFDVGFAEDKDMKDLKLTSGKIHEQVKNPVKMTVMGHNLDGKLGYQDERGVNYQLESDDNGRSASLIHAKLTGSMIGRGGSEETPYHGNELYNRMNNGFTGNGGVAKTQYCFESQGISQKDVNALYKQDVTEITMNPDTGLYTAYGKEGSLGYFTPSAINIPAEYMTGEKITQTGAKGEKSVLYEVSGDYLENMKAQEE